MFAELYRVLQLRPGYTEVLIYKIHETSCAASPYLYLPYKLDCLSNTYLAITEAVWHRNWSYGQLATPNI